MKSIHACENGKWSILIWLEQEPEKRRVVEFKCRSWRHEGECCLWRGAQDFQRIREAIASQTDWTYIVLTYAHGDWEDEETLYRAGVRTWSALRKRMISDWGPIKYIQTWERHRSGWPHVNLLVSNADLHDACVGDGWKWVRKYWLEHNAVLSGFGMRTWIEPMKDPDAMSGYLLKLAEELTGAKFKNQIPRNAPPHFRRIRASRGLLPKPYKDPLLTGKICFQTAEAIAKAYRINETIEKAISPLTIPEDVLG